MTLSCIALYYKALRKTRIFAIFRSKNCFRDFEGQEMPFKYDKEWENTSNALYCLNNVNAVQFLQELFAGNHK